MSHLSIRFVPRTSPARKDHRLTRVLAMLEAAASYAEILGFAVFGVAADCRVPIKVEGQYEHGCHDATKDPAEVRRRWTRHPRANIAVACGPDSGVFVLDIDSKGGVDGYASLAELERLNGALPASWVAATPSGGEHRYFRFPVGWELRNKVGLRVYHPDGSRTIYAGLDIRAAGGSAALPPSVKPTGRYRWRAEPGDHPLADAPEWLLKLAIDPPPPPRRPPAPLRVSELDRAARYVAAAVDGECGFLATMKANTGRNQRLFQAAANLGEFVGAGLLPMAMAERALESAATECGLAQEDGIYSVRQTIASGMRKGMMNPREVRA